MFGNKRMTDKNLEKSIRDIAAELTQKSMKEQPGVFNKDFWTGRMLEFAMKDPAFKVEMFRFVDVFAVLRSPERSQLPFLGQGCI